MTIDKDSLGPQLNFRVASPVFVKRDSYTRGGQRPIC